MIYVDTSALLKRYITEPASARFDAFFIESAPLAVSRLTFAEVRCALARRRRALQIDAALEAAALDEIRVDVQDGALRIHPIADDQVAAAFHLLGRVGEIALRTLDALHLSVATHLEASGFATADRNQAQAAQALGFALYPFF